MNNQFKIDYKNSLNEEQYDAVSTIEGPLLIIAGAGTGKTRTIVYRAAYMIENNIPASNILMLTFTNKAANEMKERVIELLGKEDSAGITACTFHSFCSSMLRRFSKYADLSPLFTILSSGDDADIIDMKKSEDTLHKYDKKGFPPSGKIADIISQSINKNLSIYDILNTQDRYEKYAEFSDEIETLSLLVSEYKQENSLLNYDDLLVVMKNMLNAHPEVADEISKVYQYIMVDEYQDTNTLQESLLFQIRKNNKNLAVVGDDLQSLYAFRGAEVQNIIDFPKKINDCKIVYLVKNYRSNQEILNLSNHVVQSATEGYKKTLIGTYSSGSKPKIYLPYSQQEETELAMDLIFKTHKAGTSYNDICILARNSGSTTGLEMELNKAQINYVKYGGKKFFDLEYVKDILAYLRVLTRTIDEIAWFRILKVHAGIGDMNAKKIAAGCKNNGIEHLLDKKYSKRNYGSELKLLYEELIKVDDMALTPLLTELIYFYIGTKKRNIESMKTDEGKRTEYLELNESHEKELQNLIAITDSYESITKFLEDLTLDNTKLTHTDAEEGQLVISTIHSVKGLEYDTVIILDCIDEIFPSTTARERGTKEDNEELRCFYVAVTRAKENLYLISPKSAFKYNKRIFGIPSHYLNGGNLNFSVIENY